MLNADISRPRAVDPEINGRIKEISDKLFGGDLSRMAMATYIQKSKLREIVNDSRYPDYSEILNIIAMAKPARIVADWLLTGEGDMLKSVTPSDSRPEVQTRPRIPTTAAAGSLSGDAASVTLRDCEQLPVISQLPAYDFTIIIKGDSMKPKYESGDEIACRRILNPSFIQWGKVHVLDTVQGIVVKKVYDDGDCIKCVSINPDYPPFSVPKDEVYSLSLVVGSLSITEM